MQLKAFLAGLAAASALAISRGQAQETGQPLRISGEVYSRVEWSDPAWISRLRLQTEINLNQRIGFLVELADVRTQSQTLDLADVRQAALRLRLNTNWSVVAGRQEIALGDERLVGADTRWNPQSPSFDGVSAGYARGRWRAGVFAAMPVTVRPSRLNLADRGHAVVGLFAATKLHEVSIEPYLLDAVGQSGERRGTAGVRSVGTWRGGFDTNAELAFQQGVGRWATHLELGRTWESVTGQPRVWAEYNLATGGPQLFDDLYPAGYSRFGLQDPYPWRDIRYSGAGAEIGHGRLRLSGTYRRYRKAEGGDSLGNHWIAGAEYDITARLTASGAFEVYGGHRQHECDLHPAPSAHPFLSLTLRL